MAAAEIQVLDGCRIIRELPGRRDRAEAFAVGDLTVVGCGVANEEQRWKAWGRRRREVSFVGNPRVLDESWGVVCPGKSCLGREREKPERTRRD